MIKKADIFLSGAIVAVAVFICIFQFLLKSDGKTVEIKVGGENFGSYRLDSDQIVEVKTKFGFNTVKIKNGRVSVIDADCPDGYCVSHVAVEKTGDTVVCLPHKMIVEIKG